MSAVELFALRDHELRGVVIDGEPWLVGRDVAHALGFANGSRDIARHTTERQRRGYRIGTPGGDQDVVLINEAGFYRMAMRANTERAVEFQDWVAEEVLPALRQTGGYRLPAQPAAAEITRAHLAQMVLDAERELEAERAKVAELEPQAAAAKAVMSADGDWSVREAAQVLSRDPAITTGQRRLFGTLRELGWVDRRGIPYQRHIEVGRLTTRVRTYDHPHTGEPTLGAPQIRVTGRGLVDLHKHLKGSVEVESLIADHEGVPA